MSTDDLILSEEGSWALLPATTAASFASSSDSNQRSKLWQFNCYSERGLCGTGLWLCDSRIHYVDAQMPTSCRGLLCSSQAHPLSSLLYPLQPLCLGTNSAKPSSKAKGVTNKQEQAHSRQAPHCNKQGTALTLWIWGVHESQQSCQHHTSHEVESRQTQPGSLTRPAYNKPGEALVEGELDRCASSPCGFKAKRVTKQPEPSPQPPRTTLQQARNCPHIVSLGEVH